MTLNPWRLRLLCQLETLGTVRAVAAAARLSPSSVSQQLAVLEAETNVQLLERSGRRIRLTPAGYLLARRARDILDRMSEAEVELRRLGEEPAGIVRVAAFQSAIQSVVVPAVHQMLAAYPALEVHVEEQEPHTSTSALLRSDVDIAVTTTDYVDAPRHPDLHLVPLATDSIVVVLPPGHPSASQPGVDLATLADEDWTFDLPDTYMGNLAARLCRQAGFEPHVVCRFNNYMITVQHVAAGGSIALLPELAVGTRNEVRTRPLAPAVTRRIVAAVRRSSTARGATREVLDALRVAARPTQEVKDRRSATQLRRYPPGGGPASDRPGGQAQRRSEPRRPR